MQIFSVVFPTIRNKHTDEDWMQNVQILHIHPEIFQVLKESGLLNFFYYLYDHFIHDRKHFVNEHSLSPITLLISKGSKACVICCSNLLPVSLFPQGIQSFL